MLDLTKMTIEELLVDATGDLYFDGACPRVAAELTRRTEVQLNINAAIGTLQRLVAKGTNQSRAYMIREADSALCSLEAALARHADGRKEKD